MKGFGSDAIGDAQVMSVCQSSSSLMFAGHAFVDDSLRRANHQWSISSLFIARQHRARDYLETYPDYSRDDDKLYNRQPSVCCRHIDPRPER